MFLNTFESIVSRIPEDIQRFQKTLQYAKRKVDYVIGEFIYMLPSSMNLRIGKIIRYNNKILIASPSFKIETNLKINLNGEKDKPDVKPKAEGVVKTKPNIKFNKESKPDMNEITHEEEKVALVLGITSISLQYGGCSNDYLLLVFVMKYVYIKTPTPVMRAHKF